MLILSCLSCFMGVWCDLNEQNEIIAYKRKGRMLVTWWAGMLPLNSGETVDFFTCVFHLKNEQKLYLTLQKKDFIYTRLMF